MHAYARILLITGLLGAAPSFAQYAGVAQFTQPPTSPCSTCLSTSPNTIYLDATSGNVMHPLPSSQRVFASASEFATFLQQNLNATPLYDGAGNVVGASGGLVQIGPTYYLDANNSIQRITEPISAFIGGIPARFTVAGVTYSTGIQGQDYLVPQSSTPSAHVYQCNSSGECVTGNSWNTHLLLHVKDSVGISVEQETGGFQQNHEFCWLGILPWICETRSGSNQLTLQGSLFWDPYLLTGTGASYTAVAYTYPPTTRVNVPDITFSKWSVCFGFGCAGASEASILVGACSQSISAAIPSTGATADGRTLGQNCYGGGVMCSVGYSLCQPNNVCSKLVSDINNCGICGNRCGAGYVCQNASCVPCTQTTTCEAAGAICGSITDACGNTWSCGTCPFPMTCSYGGCECPPGKNCNL